MAKRKNAQRESDDKLLTQWHSELLDEIRPWLIELPAEVDGDLYVVLNTEGRAFGVAAEFFESDGTESLQLRRTASAIEAIDSVRQGGDSALLPSVLLGICFSELRLESLAIRAHRASQSAADKAKLTAKLTPQQWETVRPFILGWMKHGLSKAAACKKASVQLATKTFIDLPGLQVDITGDALEKRLDKERKATRKR